MEEPADLTDSLADVHLYSGETTVMSAAGGGHLHVDEPDAGSEPTSDGSVV